MQASRQLAAGHPFRAATVAALLLAAGAVLVWTAPQPALDGATRTIAWLGHREDTAGRAIATTVLAALAAVGYVLAWARATSPRRAVRIGDGNGTIPVEDLAEALRGTVLEQPDVSEALVRVDNLHRRGLRVALLLDVTPQARLADTASSASARIEEALRQRSGLQLAEPPAIQLRYRELILRSDETGPLNGGPDGGGSASSDVA